MKSNESKPVLGRDLKLRAGMKVCAGCLLEEGCVRLFGHQSDGHDKTLAGPQETHTEFGLSSSFKNRRKGYHVLSTATETYTHTVDIRGVQTSRYASRSTVYDLDTWGAIQFRGDTF